MLEMRECEKDFDVPRSGFEANSALANHLANEFHLNDEEKAIKCAIQDLIKQLEQLKDNVNLKSNEMELANCNHFIEIRRQIDIQREELKAKIDEIALKLIAQVKERENAYNRQLKQTISGIVELDIR